MKTSQIKEKFARNVNKLKLRRSLEFSKSI